MACQKYCSSPSPPPLPAPTTTPFSKTHPSGQNMFFRPSSLLTHPLASDTRTIVLVCHASMLTRRPLLACADPFTPPLVLFHVPCRRHQPLNASAVAVPLCHPDKAGVQQRWCAMVKTDRTVRGKVRGVGYKGRHTLKRARRVNIETWHATMIVRFVAHEGSVDKKRTRYRSDCDHQDDTRVSNGPPEGS